ncbi:hypothetical protein KUTeg_001169 [Tegillarca granosa]|uniref:Uncharacterized protein n=1 Tax=Tegillarca granosa TaxID=220873 RepID=A0ABQ9FYW8_TEGGR|nr:hypothetical protein KUTeg_001169 [Tegillarca granosa]
MKINQPTIPTQFSSVVGTLKRTMSLGRLTRKRNRAQQKLEQTENPCGDPHHCSLPSEDDNYILCVFCMPLPHYKVTSCSNYFITLCTIWSQSHYQVCILHHSVPDFTDTPSDGSAIIYNFLSTYLFVSSALSLLENYDNDAIVPKTCFKIAYTAT